MFCVPKTMLEQLLEICRKMLKVLQRLPDEEDACCRSSSLHQRLSLYNVNSALYRNLYPVEKIIIHNHTVILIGQQAKFNLLDRDLSTGSSYPNIEQLDPDSN